MVHPDLGAGDVDVSLLDTGREHVLVFLEEETTDPDGNIITQPSATGILATATIQLQAQSGTSSRRSEQDQEGFESEEVYRLRFPRSFPYELGPQSRIEWRGRYFSVIGFPQRFNGSPRTAHLDYTIRRT